MDTNTFVKRFFWVAFAAFLLASIPHVAYFFRAYEPVAQGAEDIWEWCVSYAIAASIDVTIFLLSVTVAGLQRRKARKALIFSVWIFIFALALLSWYINDRYALHFLNSAMMSATGMVVNLWFIHVVISDINPLIASCFQILAIAYTWISDKLTASEVPPTAKELEILATELEAVKVQKERIKALNKGVVSTTAKSAIDGGFDIVSHAAKKFKKEKKTEVKEPAKPEVKPENDASQNDEQDCVLEIVSESQNEGYKLDKPAPIEAPLKLSESEDVVVNQYPLVLSEWLERGVKSANVDDIVRVTGQPKKRVNMQVGKALKATPRRSDLITIASVMEWLLIAPKPEQRTAQSGEMPAIKTNGKGNLKDTVKLDEFVEMSV